MNVEQKKIDALNIELTLNISAEDYAPAKKKRFANYKRKADFKGFRKGMVPASLIERVYGEQILAEAVNEVISESLNSFIKDNNLNIIGEPLSSESQPAVEWKDGNAFTFLFDIALTPEFELEVAASDEIPSYTVIIAAEDKQPMIESYKKYYEEQKSKDENAEVKTDEEIDSEVSERLNAQYKDEADWKLNKDIRDYLVSKAGFEVPEAFLKRWLLAVNGDKITQEDLEKEFPGFIKDYKWQLVRNFLMKKFDLKIENKDITDAAEAFVRYNYAMYGLPDVPAEILAEQVNGILHDQKQLERILEQVEDQKVIAKVKETVTLKPTEIAAADFRNL